ncbi:single-stranded DNA-binding protein [Nesterenkonia natronophila]|uniref:Single-stranded DNA-binding protein n=1 Tax=Nesterenkonia natronophila TaxID=2174932 RepID=A0A3A4F0R9_9MICC|nr:single-stranded DNA-binding protein [Nesterenkonia natronophila]RJN31301.1 single-stranded DNA-binding protein [Nesterenkonia natronophila]
MTETITVRGFTGTTPEVKNPDSENPVTTFRLGATPRWRSGQTGEWTSGETNWYTVACFGRLALNVADSLHKGDPVVVVGRPKVRTWRNDQNETGAEIEISAQSVGHDLKFGTTQYRKVNRSESAPPAPASTGTAEGDAADQNDAAPPPQAQPTPPTTWDGQSQLSTAA